MSVEVPAWLAAGRIVSSAHRGETRFVSVLVLLVPPVPGPPRSAVRWPARMGWGWGAWNRAVLDVRLPRSCPAGAAWSAASLVTPQSENLRGVIR